MPVSINPPVNELCCPFCGSALTLPAGGGTRCPTHGAVTPTTREEFRKKQEEAQQNRNK